MGRLIVANLLVFAVLASAAALTYYGWSYTAEVSSRERVVLEETTRELAEEKIVDFEDRIVQSDNKVFAAIRPNQPLEVAKIIKDEQAPLVSAFLLDADLQPVLSGYFSKRSGEIGKKFYDRFVAKILPQLPLRFQPVGLRGHTHGVFDGEEFLFAYEHLLQNGRDFYVVLETDLKYLIGTVFPEFFGGHSRKTLYQVVDSSGEAIFGMPFESSGVVVTESFDQTVDDWSLRVAQRDTGSNAARKQSNVIKFVLVGLSFAGIVVGLSMLLLAMRRERKSNELKSDFISNVSHELKTPLSIISMFGEMLALGRVKTPEQATEYADIIWRESVRLARLIDNVLDFAKIERGRDVYEFEEGDVGDVVARAIELSQLRAQKAEMTIEVDLASDLPPARLDGNAYTLAVMNLIDNAIKYAVEGKKMILRLYAEKDRIVLEVKDFGPGIDPDEHKSIFERFYRARAVRLKPIRGSGIGLALVDHIARAHGGGTWVKSQPGQGATFGLWIPVAAEA